MTRGELLERIRTSRELEELEATLAAARAYLVEHPDDREISMELESVILLISAIRSGRSGL